MRKLTLGLISTTCLLVFGCATPYYGPLQNIPQVPEEKAATLVVIVEKRVQSSSVSLVPSIDGIEAYALNNNQYIVFHIAPGEHTVIAKFGQHVNGAQIQDKSIARFHQKLGETMYLYLIYHTFPVMFPYVEIVQLTEEQARPLMEKATRVGPQ